MKLPKTVQFILQRYWTQGFEAYVVGGCVRDFFLGKIPQDYDIAVSATPEETKRLFSEYQILEHGIQHGTLTLLIEDKPFEVTTYRVEGKYIDHRRPSEVHFTQNLQEDLRRRDFTINAMAYYGRLFDFFGGIEDLKEKKIRCVGDPEQRFEEDGLRILRALRFASVFDFSVESSTKKAIFQKKDRLQKISNERIREEWIKLLSGAAAEQVLLEFQSVINEFFPGFRPCCFPDDVRDPFLRLCFLLNETYGVSQKDQSIEIMKMLRYDKKSCHDAAVLLSMFGSPFYTDKIHIKQYLNMFGKELTEKTALLKGADIQKELQEITCNQECYMLSDLALNGQDLMKLGIPPGRQVGETLQILLDYVLQYPWENTPEQLKKYLQNKL